jgi:hypothetical protein
MATLVTVVGPLVRLGALLVAVVNWVDGTVGA